MVAPKKIAPAASAYSLNLLENYKNNLHEFVALVSKCRNVDLDKTIINSPAINWITYSLRDALEFLFEHEHRHLNQAIKVKQHVGYPKT